MGAEPVRLVSPGDGDRWAAGSIHYLAYDTFDPTPGAVAVDYARDGGVWVPALTQPGEWGLLWTVPDGAAGACRVRVTRKKDGSSAEAAVQIIPSQQGQYEWTCVTSKAPFAPRDGAGAMVYGGRMWLIGGWHPAAGQVFPRTCTNEVWSSPDGAAWTLVKPNTFLDDRFDSARDWEGRHTAGWVVHRNKMWIVGGDMIQGHYQSDVWNSSDGRTWTPVNPGRPAPWGPRSLAYTVSFNDWIWVIGGQTVPQIGPAEERFYHDAWRSRDGVEWERMQPADPSWPQRGMIGGSAVLGGRLWLMGGGTYDTPSAPQRKMYNDVWSTADGVRWRRDVDHAPWTPRQYHEVAAYDGRLWVLEGFGQPHGQYGNRNDVWYSSDGVNWYEVQGTRWKPRHAASVFVHDGSLWVVAGNNMESDVWRLSRARRDK